MFTKDNLRQPSCIVIDSNSYLIKQDAVLFRLPKLHLDPSLNKVPKSGTNNLENLTPRNLKKGHHVSPIDNRNLSRNGRVFHSEIKELRTLSRDSSTSRGSSKFIPQLETLRQASFINDNLKKTLEFSCTPFARHRGEYIPTSQFRNRDSIQSQQSSKSVDKPANYGKNNTVNTPTSAASSQQSEDR